ncbi:MAG: FAD-binding oxidoreductase [Candidatus Izemoplasmatales bacterium]|nr:FAD-binding oxidoreductase [Candidatus Izemoplasmatales bacterium]MDD4355057.1 FAD-binding oxidoreductase [Candidatus Izemoplasmatales bacterium]MDD4987463.1 FAD-binding oxidoreductase [Candidatus Izemoplasmatales bacterium]
MNADVVIIGSGISGASIAYNLALRGLKNIVVIDKSYPTSGSTGRCGAGVRQQWGTKGNCIMAKHSIEFFETAQKTLDYHEDIEFKQEGYLILATTIEEEKEFAENILLQNSLNIPARQLTKEEALAIVPHLNPDAFISATFCPTDGHLNPFKMTDAYYQAAKKQGVLFRFFEEVTAIERYNGKIQAVITQCDRYDTSVVVNAAGGFAREIAEMVGVDLPVYPENHEILVTEPVAKMQGPMVMSFSKNIYCQQVPHGSFLMGRTTPGQPSNHDIGSSWQFLDEMAKTVCDILPKIGELRVIRQWGGSYAVSPDHQPIISSVKQQAGFYLACGFSGHGFMFAPMTGILLSEIMLDLPPTLDVSEYDLDRFTQNQKIVKEKSVV